MPPVVQIVFIGRIMDELTIKVVEVKKIQADVTVGTTKCRTRELLTFFPQVNNVISDCSCGSMSCKNLIRFA